MVVTGSLHTWGAYPVYYTRFLGFWVSLILLMSGRTLSHAFYCCSWMRAGSAPRAPRWAGLQPPRPPRIMGMFHGGGVAGRPPAAVTAFCRVVPTTLGSPSQYRIVWLDHVSRGTTELALERVLSLRCEVSDDSICPFRSPVCRR